MMHPNMATMLSFLTTDVNISRGMLDKALKDSIKDSYNMISVDGDTSTNDMVCIMANKEANNKIIDSENEDYKIFKDALDYVNKVLAKMIFKDGSGARKFIEVNVSGAKLIKDGTIHSGMIPKIENCIYAIKKGVNSVHIIDGRVKHSLFHEIFTNSNMGTMIK